MLITYRSKTVWVNFMNVTFVFTRQQRRDAHSATRDRDDATHAAREVKVWRLRHRLRWCIAADALGFNS